MATTLAPVDSREVVRCDRCQMVQFRTLSGLCRRCRTSLDHEDPPALEVLSLPQPEPEPPGPGVQVAGAIRLLRNRNGLSQRQLAQRMRVPRTYVSKIENEKATPTLSSLARLAEALEVTIPDLLNGGNGQGNLQELLADNFIAELALYLPRLNALDRQSVLTQMREMTMRTRRSA